VPLVDGAAILAIGLACMVLLEIEKALLRRWDVFEELAAPRPSSSSSTRESFT
jgi:hypothetical protein